MKSNYIYKYQIRNIYKTILFVILLTISVAFIAISILMNYSSTQFIKNSKQAYTVIANLNIKSIDYTSFDGVDTNEFPAFKSKYLKDFFDWDRFLGGITEYLSFDRIDMDGRYSEDRDNNILLVEVLEIIEGEVIKVKVIETLYGYEIPQYIDLDYYPISKEIVGKQVYIHVIKFIQLNYTPEGYVNDYGYSYLYYDVTTEENESILREKYSIMAEYYAHFNQMVEVKPINNVNAIRGFNLGVYFISDGSNFTDEDYIKGNDVCLISKDYAIKNGLQVGDQIDISFEGTARYKANFNNRSVINIKNLNLDKKDMERTFIIKGLYEQTSKYNIDLANFIDPNRILIPEEVLEKMTPLLSSYAKPSSMTISGGYNYIFELVDGDSIELFLEDLENEGVNLEKYKFTFFDQGYSKIKPIYKSMADTSRGLVIVSIGVMMLISMLMTYIFIIKRKREIAILRVLGIKKCKIYSSFIVSLLITILLGCFLGNVVGISSYKQIINRSYNLEIDKLSLSESEGIVNIPIEQIIESNMVLVYLLLISVITVVYVFLISTIILIKIIRKEPIRLLT